MTELINSLRKELEANADPERIESTTRFFREKINTHGIRSAVVSSIGKKYFSMLKGKSKEEIFSLCEELWKTEYIEENIIACEWSYKVNREYKPDDFILFERWVDLYISNWATCDTFCNHTVGRFVEMYPGYVGELKRWALSDNRWKKRASAVSLIIPARHGLFTDDIFDIAGILLSDKDDMVQKGYGWMLKATSQAYQQKVFEYVMSKKSVMPRTALRYAIEKMPAELKSEAMRK